MTRLSPNQVEACPSESRRRTHAAHGQICGVCTPEEIRRDRCPGCGFRVEVVGFEIQPHGRRKNGWTVRCGGSGQRLRRMPAVELRIWVGRRAVARP
ncbi:hypothetical protein [Actinoplanes rectilineatus]|uniref:hypothetical protein n=1 Tax=Actinoplanes rectilineatus TaxID=113571 RepID=UPI0005F27B30|nr:hypothetical protein [Actinoplanes rectilineatus]